MERNLSSPSSLFICARFPFSSIGICRLPYTHLGLLRIHHVHALGNCRLRSDEPAERERRDWVLRFPSTTLPSRLPHFRTRKACINNVSTDSYLGSPSTREKRGRKISLAARLSSIQFNYNRFSLPPRLPWLPPAARPANRRRSIVKT